MSMSTDYSEITMVDVGQVGMRSVEVFWKC